LVRYDRRQADRERRDLRQADVDDLEAELDYHRAQLAGLFDADPEIKVFLSELWTPRIDALQAELDRRKRAKTFTADSTQSLRGVITEAKGRIDIDELVERAGVELTRPGSSRRGCCPFHDDRNPSLVVWPSKGRWRCFGCSVGGDHLDFIQEWRGTDWIGALRYLADMTGVPWPERRKRPAEDGQAEPVTMPAADVGGAPATVAADDLPLIITSNRALRDISADAIRALEMANTPPMIFVRSGMLVRVRADEKHRPVIETLNDATLRGRLARVATFKRVSKDGDFSHVKPPDDVVKDVLSLGEWAFPALEGVVEMPTLKPDGMVLDTSGYDFMTRLAYIPAPGLSVREVPEMPPASDVTAALALIDEAVGEFPYSDDASRANTLALLLTPIVRPAIRGHVPLSLIDAPQAGTGKSLLAEVVSLIATGRSAAMIAAPRDDDEWRKRITAALLTGATVVTIDNVEYPLDAPSLGLVLTCDTWADRILGRSELLYLPQRATWLVTGNNIKLRGDLPRRCYWIRLDAKTSRPWRRTGFTHADLPGWVAEHRGALLSALLTLARAWFVAGCPSAEGLPVLGSYEQWTRIIGGILAYAGVTGFLGNLEQLYALADEEAGQWEAFFTAWFAMYSDRAITVAQVTKDLSKTRDNGEEYEHQTLRDALPDDLADALEGERSEKRKSGGFQRKLGKALSKRSDVRYGDRGIHLERAGTDPATGVRILWRVAFGPEANDVPSFQVSQVYPNPESGKKVSCGLSEYADRDGAGTNLGNLETWETTPADSKQPKEQETVDSQLDLPPAASKPAMCCEPGCDNPVAAGGRYFCERHRPSSGIPF
jgi:hypothetical protein